MAETGNRGAKRKMERSEFAEARAREKQQARERDAQALRSGQVSPAALRAENGAFVFPKASLRLSGAKRLS